MSDASIAAEHEREKSKNVRALSALLPFFKPYRLLVLAAMVALVITAMISLILPIAVRRVVDGVCENYGPSTPSSRWF